MKVTYAEGVLVGYRWFVAKKIDPHFPFGFGLSYTTFDISNLKLSATLITLLFLLGHLHLELEDRSRNFHILDGDSSRHLPLTGTMTITQ